MCGFFELILVKFEIGFLYISFCGFHVLLFVFPGPPASVSAEQVKDCVRGRWNRLRLFATPGVIFKRQ